MPFNETTGQWEVEDDSVSSRVTGLIASDSPFMKQARTQGAQAANRRGLLNSSIAGQSGAAAAYQAAVPIASQEAQQVSSRNLQGMQLASSEKVAGMNIAANDRYQAAQEAAKAAGIRGEVYRTVAQQHELPADTRDAYLEEISRRYDSDLALVEQIFGVDLDWASPTLPAPEGGA